jgi:hypothetical protein
MLCQKISCTHLPTISLVRCLDALLARARLTSMFRLLIILGRLNSRCMQSPLRCRCRYDGCDRGTFGRCRSDPLRPNTGSGGVCINHGSLRSYQYVLTFSLLCFLDFDFSCTVGLLIVSRVLGAGYRHTDRLRRVATPAALRLKRPPTLCRRVLYEPFCIDLDCTKAGSIRASVRSSTLKMGVCCWGATWFSCAVVLKRWKKLKVRLASGHSAVQLLL